MLDIRIVHISLCTRVQLVSATYTSGVAKPGPGRARPDQYYARPGQSE